MANTAALNQYNTNNWSDPNAWQSGQVPTSNPGLVIDIPAGTSGYDDLASLAAKEVDFENGNGAYSDLVVGGTLDVNAVNGAGNPQLPSNVQVYGRLNTDTLSGGLDVTLYGTLEVSKDINDTSFVLTGGRPVTTLILDHPKLGFIHNVLNFQPPKVSPFAPVLGPERIEIGHLDFNAVSFAPPPEGSPYGTLSLLNDGKVVMQDDHVIAFGGSNNHFSVGVDTATGYNYVQYAAT